jgi:hypothetical protein
VPTEDKSEAWETLRMRHSEIRRVPLDSIYVDPRFQRALGSHRKDQILNEYHPEGIGTVVVATVKGGDPADSGRTYASIDGQTRLVALDQLRREVAAGTREIDGPVPTEVLAEVYERLTVQEAAVLFQLRNFQTAVPVRERDRIAFTEGDPTLQEAVRQVELAGYTLFSENGTAATMPYVDVAKRVVRWARKYGRPDLLAEALTVQANAFGAEIGDVDKVVLQATANLLRKNTNLDDERFTELLRSRTTARITGEAQVIRTQLNMRQATATEFYLAREYNALKGVEKIRH